MRLLATITLLALGACAPSEQSEPDHSAAVIQLAEARIATGELETARALLEDWLAANPGASAPERARLLRYAAHVRTLRKEHEEALAHLDVALPLAPEDPWLHYGRGMALHELGEYAAAIDAYAAALERDPRHVKAAQWRGYSLALLGRNDEALREYDRALEILANADENWLATWDGDRAAMQCRTLFDRANALDELEEHDRAEADRQQARSIADGGGR